jgi:hypothetical protein
MIKIEFVLFLPTVAVAYKSNAFSCNNGYHDDYFDLLIIKIQNIP